MGKWVGGWIKAIPIHSLPPQRGAPSPVYLPPDLLPAAPSPSLYLHRGLSQLPPAPNGPDAIIELGSISSPAAKRAGPLPRAIYGLGESRVRLG